MVDVDASVLLNMQKQIAALQARVDAAEQFQEFHQGISLGAQGSAFPHPYLTMVSGDFGTNQQARGGTTGRLDQYGIRLLQSGGLTSVVTGLTFEADFTGNPNTKYPKLHELGLNSGSEADLILENIWESASNHLASLTLTTTGAAAAATLLAQNNSLTPTAAQVQVVANAIQGAKALITGALNVWSSAADPAVTAKGDFLYRSDTNKYRGYNGALDNFAMEAWVTAALPVGGTPNLTLGTANAAGAAATFVKTDATILAFDATAPVTQAFGDVAAAGTATVAAKRDHKHGMPATPSTGWAPVYRAKTANFTAAYNDIIDCTSGTFAVTLPAATTNGGIIVVKNSGAGVITITPNGADTVEITTLPASSNMAVMLVADGTSKWKAI